MEAANLELDIGRGSSHGDRDTLYGIDENKFTNEIDPKTSSSVRGEELLNFMNLIQMKMVTQKNYLLKFGKNNMKH
jgi:hypothetical protein